MDDFAGEDASGHQPVTIDEYLDELEEQELEADLVLGGDNGDECTYSKGYMKRQAIFSCLTCTPDGNAGVCTACSLSCHDGHEVVELWTKRNFRCDCGNSKFGEFICKLCPNKDVENVENAYNHNFKGVYCTCGRPYPDPENEDEQEMLQCCVCEDWFHRAHLGLESCDEIPRDEEDENLYEDLMCPACSATCSFLTLYPEKIWASTRKEDAAENAKKQKALIEEVHSESASTTKLDNGGSCSDPMKNYENGPVVGGSLCSKRDCIIGVDLGVAAPVIERTKPMFLAKGWREVLCQCEKCLKFYNEKRIGFLLEKEDSITEYEKMAKRKREENKEKQEASFPLNLLDNFGHVEKMEILHGIEELKNEIGNWLASRDHSKTVTAAEVQETFENIKKKRRREL